MATISELASRVIQENRHLIIWPVRKDQDSNIHYEILELSPMLVNRDYRKGILFDVEAATMLMSARSHLSGDAKARFDTIPLASLAAYARRFAPCLQENP